MDPVMINYAILCIHEDKKIIHQRICVSVRYGSKKGYQRPFNTYQIFWPLQWTYSEGQRLHFVTLKDMHSGADH